MPTKIPVDDVIQDLYDRIPEEIRSAIIKENKKKVLKNSQSMRLQPFISKELFVVLTKYGAFHQGESTLINQALTDIIKSRYKFDRFREGA